MPHISMLLDVDRPGSGFKALMPYGDAASAAVAGKLIHISNDAIVEVGTLRHGMASGKDSVALCFTLPDGKIVLWETSVEIFVVVAQGITAWQEGRRDRGED
jgi:hypothetical protein